MYKRQGDYVDDEIQREETVPVRPNEVPDLATIGQGDPLPLAGRYEPLHKSELPDIPCVSI